MSERLPSSVNLLARVVSPVKVRCCSVSLDTASIDDPIQRNQGLLPTALTPSS